MQEQNQRQQSYIFSTLDSARQKLREIRQELPAPFRRSQKDILYHISAPSDQQDQCPRLPESIPPRVNLAPIEPSIAPFNPVMDGTGDRLLGRGQKSQSPANVSAIFVHAGAGYHSTTNEHLHLGACNE